MRVALLKSSRVLVVVSMVIFITPNSGEAQQQKGLSPAQSQQKPPASAGAQDPFAPSAPQQKKADGPYKVGFRCLTGVETSEQPLKDLEAALNTYAAQGWELVATTRLPDKRYTDRNTGKPIVLTNCSAYIFRGIKK